MPVKLQPIKPTTSGIPIISLCFLDNLVLDKGPFQLDDCEICTYSSAELKRLLYGRDDLEAHQDDVSNFPCWGGLPCLRRRDYAGDCTRLRARGLGDVSDLDCARTLFRRHPLFGDEREPFKRVIQLLNLTKPLYGPVIPCQILMRPENEIQTKQQVSRRTISSPMMGSTDDGQDYYVLKNNRLTASDKEEYIKVRQHFDRVFSTQEPIKHVDNSSLAIALHRFDQADRRFAPYHQDRLGFCYLDPLMDYEACLEALLIREEEGDVENLFSRRVVRALGHEFRNAAGPSTSDLDNFVRKVFVLRSKIAHGAWPVHKIADLVVVHQDRGIGANRRRRTLIPDSQHYRNMFGFSETTDAFPGFLVSLRELARRMLRFFLEKQSAGQSRDEILRALDRKAKGAKL